MENVQLEGVWIGDLRITLNLERFEIHVANLSIDREDKGGFHHPHVSANGEICWNEHDEEARQYHGRGEYLALKDLIENLLRTYNSRSPYITLEDWENGVGASCDRCGERWPEEELCWSRSCEMELCEDCRLYCERCEDYVPDDRYDSGLEACDSCLELHTDRCAGCGDRFWENELAELETEWFGKRQAVLFCELCREEHESKAGMEDEHPKEESKDEQDQPDDDDPDAPGLLAPAVALPPDPV